MYFVNLSDVFLSDAGTMRLSLKLLIREHCCHKGPKEQVEISARTTVLLVRGMLCPHSPGLALTPDMFSEMTGTFLALKWRYEQECKTMC